MAYQLPQPLVFQEFTQLPTAIVDPLRAHIAGGNAQLFRFSESAEKVDALLGSYDPLIDTVFSYPSQPTGSIVDQDYFKLYADDVLLEYHSDVTSGSYGTVTALSAFKNRIQSSAVNYKENTYKTTTYARHSSLLERDVQVGDVVNISGSAGSPATVQSLRTTVKDIRGVLEAATIAASTADANNVGATSQSESISKTGGPANCVTFAADGTSYDGAVDGDITETYTITVTTSSTDGDHTTARLRVRSASGNDDQASVTPAASGAPTSIGTRGLTVTFGTSEAESCSSDADEANVSYDDLIIGQEFSAAVAQDWTPITHAEGATYTGAHDTTYIVEVTRGGDIADATKPQVTVSTTTGVDVSGPTNVVTSGTPVAVGTKGLEITFTGTSLAKGDIYYIIVTGEFEGNHRILVLNNSIPQDFIDEATDLTLKLYIPKKGVEIPERRGGAPGVVNYVLGDPGILDTGFTVESGITLFDATWVDAAGDEQALDVAEATLYAEYRAWLSTKSASVYSISEVGNLADIPGQTHPDNELKWAVFKALENSNGTEVKYTAVADPSSTASWQAALDQLVGRDDTYGLVPLTRDTTVLGLWSAHVDSQSTAQNGRWRSLWINLAVETTTVVVDATKTSDLAEALAIVEDDPDVAGDQFVIVSVAAGNAKFITNGVQAGDIMRFSFVPDGWGDTVYDEFVVDAVISEDSLRLQTGQGSVEVTVAKKMEVWRNLNADALATQLAGKAAAYANTRIKAVWPDTVGSGGETFAGYHLCAALAGLRSGVVPNQNLTNVEISGFDDFTRTTDLFNKTQLDTMADDGVWIVTERNPVITRHALTTAGYGDILTQEEMVISNVDSMSYMFQSQTADLSGVANVTPGTLELVRHRIEGIITFFKEVRVDRLGGQLIEGVIDDLRAHTILKDHIVSDLTLTVPVPLNNLSLNLTIIA